MLAAARIVLLLLVATRCSARSAGVAPRRRPCSARSARASTASCSSPSSPPSFVPVVALAIVTRNYVADEMRGQHRAGSRAHRLRGPPRRRGSRRAARGAAGRRRRRQPDGLGEPADRSGRQHLRGCAARWPPANATCSRPACCRRARRPTSTAPSSCSSEAATVTTRTHRRARVSRRGDADDGAAVTDAIADRAADVAPAGDRRADRHARPPRAAWRAAVHPGRRRARLLDGGAHRRSGQPPDPRDAAHRPRRSRRARRRDSSDELRRLVDDFNRMAATCSASGSSSNAPTGSRRGPRWRGRSRTRSRTR